MSRARAHNRAGMLPKLLVVRFNHDCCFKHATGCPPPYSSGIRIVSSVRPPPWREFTHFSAASRRPSTLLMSHMIFVAEKYGEIGKPVLSRKRSAPPSVFSSLPRGVSRFKHHSSEVGIVVGIFLGVTMHHAPPSSRGPVIRVSAELRRSHLDYGVLFLTVLASLQCIRRIDPLRIDPLRIDRCLHCDFVSSRKICEMLSIRGTAHNVFSALAMML